LIAVDGAAAVNLY